MNDKVETEKEPIEPVDTVKEEAKEPSLRDTIRAAVDEHKEAAEEEPKKQEAKEPPELKKPVEEAKAPKEKSDAKLPPEEDKPDDKPATVAKDAPKPPGGWTKEGKAAWNNLPPDVQKSVLKREEEFSAGIKQYAEKARGYEELEQVITPYKQMIANYGVTPAQTIDRLFQWMLVLGHPDKKVQLKGFQELATQFKLDFNYDPDSDTPNSQEPKFDPRIIDQAVTERVGPLEQRLKELADQRESEMRETANRSIAEWSKDKPHFEQVRHSMFNLIQSGIVPLKTDGSLDLDTAYQKAILLDSEVHERVQQEAAEKAAEEARQKAAKDASDKAARLRKAQAAGVGIRPTAPSLSAPYGKPNANVPNNKDSVRDSIRKTIRELNDQPI